jgi:hypothetical protein
MSPDGRIILYELGGLDWRLEWTGLDYWTGLLDWVTTLRMRDASFLLAVGEGIAGVQSPCYSQEHETIRLY